MRRHIQASLWVSAIIFVISCDLAEADTCSAPIRPLLHSCINLGTKKQYHLSVTDIGPVKYKSLSGHHPCFPFPGEAVREEGLRHGCDLHMILVSIVFLVASLQLDSVG